MLWPNARWQSGKGLMNCTMFSLPRFVLARPLWYFSPPFIDAFSLKIKRHRREKNLLVTVAGILCILAEGFSRMQEIRGASKPNKFQSTTSPQTAISSGSEQQQKKKCQSTWEVLSNWKIWIAEINFYFAIPWDIRRWNFSAAFVRRFTAKDFMFNSCFPFVFSHSPPRFIAAFFGLLWLIRRVICKVIKVMMLFCFPRPSVDVIFARGLHKSRESSFNILTCRTFMLCLA